MAFNYAHEKNKFELRWRKLRAQYESLGMPKQEIDALYELDWKEFRQNRNYYLHNKLYFGENLDVVFSDAEKEAVKERLRTQDKYFTDENWIDDVSHPLLYQWLTSLKKEDLQLIQKLMDGYRQCEIAQDYGVTQQAIARRLLRLKNNLKKVLEKGC